ncbi:hypothetical protein A9Q99_12880 [Gammaproteobacteria bacterium 45_16_T64]|nr:hypothetical protein A9Q99_12880 [Gammaproteobacteria bacterium 45_16_T64]
MSVMTKIHTLFRSRVRESAEMLIDANAIRVFEQELVDSHGAITEAKHQLTLLMAERLRVERVNHDLEQQIKERESQATKALNKDKGELAAALAGDIVDLEHMLERQTSVLSALLEREVALKGTVQRRVKRMQEFQRELRVVKATQNAHRVMGNIEGEVGVRAGQVDLQASLNRIHDLQQQVDDQYQAADELESYVSSRGLDQQLEDAGIVSKDEKVNAVLARIQS